MAAMTAWVLASAGALIGAGCFLLVVGLRRSQRAERSIVGARHRGPRGTRTVHLAACVGVAMVVLLATGWPVGALMAAGVAAVLPSVFGGRAARQGEIVRIEAIATWTGQLRDMLVGGSGLLETIEASAPMAPAAIRTEVARLAAEMRGGRLVGALGRFAADMANPTADLVAAALGLAATEQAGRLGELLDALSQRTTEQAALQVRIECDRASTRTQARGVALVTLACVVGLVIFDRGLLDAYDSAGGQAVLALVGGCFLGGFALLARMARMPTPERFLLGHEEPA